MLAMLDIISSEGLTQWVEIVVCVLVLELVAREVELGVYSIVGSDTMKREMDSIERIERIQELNILYYHTLIIDYMI